MLLTGWALALLVLAPTADRLDRRLALNLAVTAGLVPTALWLPPVLGSRTAALATLLAGTAGSVVALAVGRGRLLPAVHRRDGLVAATGLLAGLVALPLAWPGSPARALAMLSTGIDNSYHYAMFLEQRLTTVGSPLVAAQADPSGFAFASYPQWFHRLLAVLAQVGSGDPASAPVELVRYARLEWVVFVGLAVLVAAALFQALPQEVPASLLVPSVAVLWSLVLGVPGAVNLLQGHLSFLLAATAPLVMLLLAAGSARPGVGLFVVLGGLVLVTASWLLLLPMAAAALVAPGLTVWRRQRPAVRWGALGAGALASLAAFAGFVLPWLAGSGLAAVVRDGTVPRVGLPTMLPVLLGSVVLLAALARRTPGAGLGAHVLLAGAAAGQTLVLGGYLLAETGTLTYYFWKLGLGSLLVTTVAVVHALLTSRAARGGAGVRPLASLAITLVAATGFGSVLHEFTAPSAVWAAIVPGSLESRPASGDAGDVGLVLDLAASLDPADAARTRLLATRPQDMNAAHASAWFHALSHSATSQAMDIDDGVYELALEPGDVDLALSLALDTLGTADGRVVVTDPALRQAIIDAAGPRAAPRVTLAP